MPISLLYDGLALTSRRITGSDTAQAIGAGIYKYSEYKLHIDDGGTVAITAGMQVLGATSAAVGIVVKVGTLEGAGTWAGGNAQCYLWLKAVVGTFQNNEKLTIDNTADDATVDGVLIGITKDEYVYPEYYGLTARQLWVQAETNDLRVGFVEIPTQTGKMGMLLGKGSSLVLTDAQNMADCKVIDAVSGSVGYANVVGLF